MAKMDLGTAPDVPIVRADTRGHHPPPEAQIWQFVVKLRKALGGLQAKKVKDEKTPYPVKSAKELMMKFRVAVDQYGMICHPVFVEQTVLPKEKGCIVSLAMVWRLTCLVDGSYLDIAVPTLGADSQDKATGKAITYGWKYAIAYLCSLPDADIKQVWDAAGDFTDNDNDHQPTKEPKGIEEVNVKRVVEEIKTITTLDAYDAKISEIRGKYSRITLLAIANELKGFRATLEGK